jgi:hypothetical protein
MTASETHIDTLQAFGYTREEAHFLYLVATHSGYFMARHFLAFTGAHWGKRTTLFWTKLQTNKHARTECFPKHGVVYHLFARKLYRHLGRENLRNRREHEIEYVQRRLAMLDFVLAHLTLNYLETEPDKHWYFEQMRGVPTHYLPCKTYYGQPNSQPTVRYFVDRFPMYLDASSAPPVVTFSYIQPAEVNLTEFGRHLTTYLPLFRELSEFRLLYLARTDSHFDKAKEQFESLVTIPLGSNPSDDLLRYFTVRRAWDERQYALLSEADLIFRNQAKQRFAAPRFEQMYRSWKTGRVQDAQVRDEFQSSDSRHIVHFETRLLEPVGVERRESKETR